MSITTTSTSITNTSTSCPKPSTDINLAHAFAIGPLIGGAGFLLRKVSKGSKGPEPVGISIKNSSRIHILGIAMMVIAVILIITHLGLAIAKAVSSPPEPETTSTTTVEKPIVP